MARATCPRCERPEKTCICSFTHAVNNAINLIVLQHPNEVKQAKGTVSLLSNSLKKCEVIVGESFQQNEVLQAILKENIGGIALLFPHETALEITPDNQINSSLKHITHIIVLDGTWKKAYKMYMLNENLHQLPHIQLSENFVGQYDIRKTKKTGALSTLEACSYTLGCLEGNVEKYQVLFDNFQKFNQFLKSFTRQ